MFSTRYYDKYKTKFVDYFRKHYENATINRETKTKTSQNIDQIMQSDNANDWTLTFFQSFAMTRRTLLRQSNRAHLQTNEIVRYFCIENLKKENSSWQFWKNNVLNYSNFTQMIKNVLFVSIFSIKIERVFNFVKKVCIWDRA